MSCESRLDLINDDNTMLNPLVHFYSPPPVLFSHLPELSPQPVDLPVLDKLQAIVVAPRPSSVRLTHQPNC